VFELTRLIVPNTAITSAVDVQPGFTPQAPLDPSICRNFAGDGVSRPANDSEIHFEVWMPPAANWNRKFEGSGNGDFPDR